MCFSSLQVNVANNFRVSIGAKFDVGDLRMSQNMYRKFIGSPENVPGEVAKWDFFLARECRRTKGRLNDHEEIDTRDEIPLIQ